MLFGSRVAWSRGYVRCRIQVALLLQRDRATRRVLVSCGNKLRNKPTTKVEEVELECYGRRVCAENSQDASSAASTVNKLDVAEFR